MNEIIKEGLLKLNWKKCFSFPHEGMNWNKNSSFWQDEEIFFHSFSWVIKNNIEDGFEGC
jgi:hypothetical protein